MKRILSQLKKLASSNSKQENFYYPKEEQQFSDRREVVRVIARSTILKP